MALTTGSKFNEAYEIASTTLDSSQEALTGSRKKNADAFRKWTEEMAKDGQSISMEDAIAYRNEIARLDPTLRNGQLSDRIVESLVGRSNQKAAKSILADASQMTADYVTGYENIANMVQTDGDYDSFLTQYGHGLVGPEVVAKDKNAGKREATTAAAQFGFDENAFYEAQHKKRQEAINTAATTKLFTDSADIDDINYHFANRPAWLREGLGRLMQDKVAKDRLNKINKVQTLYSNWNNDTWATYDEDSFLRLIKSQLEFEGIEPTDAELNRFATLFQSRMTVASSVKQASALKAARAGMENHHLVKDTDDVPPEEALFEAFNSLLKQNGGTPYETIEEWRTNENGATWLINRSKEVKNYEKTIEQIRTATNAAIDAEFGKDGDYTKGGTYGNFAIALGSNKIPAKGDGQRPDLVAIAKAFSQQYYVPAPVSEQIIADALVNFDPQQMTVSEFVAQNVAKHKLKTREQYKAIITQRLQDQLNARVTPDTQLTTYYADVMGDIQSLRKTMEERLKSYPPSAKKDGSWVDPNAQALIKSTQDQIELLIRNFENDIGSDTYFLFTDIRSREASEILATGRVALKSEKENLTRTINTTMPEGEESPISSDGFTSGGEFVPVSPSATSNATSVIESRTDDTPIGELKVEWEDDGTVLRLTPPAITKTVSNGRGGVMNKTEYLPITWDLLDNDIKQKLVSQAYNNIKARATGMGKSTPLEVQIESGTFSLDWVHGEEEMAIMNEARKLARELWIKEVAAMENQQRIETQTP